MMLRRITPLLRANVISLERYLSVKIHKVLMDSIVVRLKNADSLLTGERGAISKQIFDTIIKGFWCKDSIPDIIMHKLKKRGARECLKISLKGNI